ncbi:MAG TPA: cation diffusion facilitator family transporter [Ktedonobacterales bacterium]|nr:cation diffusion facilitator family transporter [Ktedonobacterales bacterium]
MAELSPTPARHDENGELPPQHRHDTEHSHVSADHFATSTREGLRVVAIATAGMFIVAAVEFSFFAISHSAGLLSDALHNMGDVLTTVAIWAAFLVARRPANTRYTYGYTRAEDLAGAFITLVIVASALAAAWESYIHLISNNRPTQIGWGIAAALFGFMGNEVLAQYKIAQGKRLNSEPLIADGQHSRTDGLTSLAAAAGLGLTLAGVPHADPVAGLLISVAILYILVEIGRDVFRRLMDAVDPSVIEQIREQALAVPGVRELTEVRARWGGRRLFIAFNIGADAALSLAEAHAIAERARQEVLTHVRGAAIVDIHVDPVGMPPDEDPHAWMHDDHHDHQHDGHEQGK